MQLPRKVRFRAPKQSRRAPGKGRMDRTGRTYDDFLALPIGERARVCQADSVVGLASNAQRILTLMLVRHSFQLYLLQADGTSARTVSALDALERYLGSPGAFRAVFDPLLADRGSEFDDWAGMERSCLVEGAARCRVYYCDPMESNQKSQCGRNHEELRRILPKGRSDFNALSAVDVAVACSHVNSCPRPSRGSRCPYEACQDSGQRNIRFSQAANGTSGSYAMASSKRPRNSSMTSAGTRSPMVSCGR